MATRSYLTRLTASSGGRRRRRLALLQPSSCHLRTVVPKQGDFSTARCINRRASVQKMSHQFPLYFFANISTRLPVAEQQPSVITPDDVSGASWLIQGLYLLAGLVESLRGCIRRRHPIPLMVSHITGVFPGGGHHRSAFCAQPGAAEE